jgi:hypothetical protein
VLVPAVLTAAAVLVPGVAAADEGTPLDPLTQTAEDLLTGGGADQGGAGPVPVPAVPEVLPGAGEPAPEEPPPGLDPAALAELLAPLGISEECVNGVYEDFTAIVDALATGGEDLQNLLTELVGALQNGGQGLGPETLTESDLAAALQDLITTLQEDCVPTTPGGTPPPSAGGNHPEPPAPVVPAAAPAPAQQPVSYPGYAPTGGTPGDGVPLGVLAGVVLLSGLRAAGYRGSSRAARG